MKLKPTNAVRWQQTPAKTQTQAIIRVEDVEKVGAPNIMSGNIKWHSDFGKWFGCLLKWWTWTYHIWLRNFTSRYMPSKKQKYTPTQWSVHRCSWKHYPSSSKSRNDPKSINGRTDQQKYRCILQFRWTLKTLCWVKEAGQKTLHMTWFYLYEHFLYFLTWTQIYTSIIVCRSCLFVCFCSKSTIFFFVSFCFVFFYRSLCHFHFQVLNITWLVLVGPPVTKMQPLLSIFGSNILPLISLFLLISGTIN